MASPLSFRNSTAASVLVAAFISVALSVAACSGGPASPTAPAGQTTLTSASPDAPDAGGAGGGNGGGTSAAEDTTEDAGTTGSNDDGAGQAPAVGGGFGRLAVDITDSPFSDAQAVLVTFVEVSAHRTGGGWETIPFADEASSRTCDLKKLEGPTDILGVGELPAGKYTQLRLTVGSGSIHFANPSEGEACASEIPEPEGLRGTVEVPSGVIKLNRPFTLAADGATTILLDFDGDRSISQKGGPKNSKPEKPGCNGNSNKPGCDDPPAGDGEDEEADLDAGTFMMKPVIGVVSVDEEGGGVE